MKKIEYKLFDIPQMDLEVAMNQEGQAGWRAAHPIGTPNGMKFLMERISDEDVSTEDLELARKAARDAELASRFGLGVSPGGQSPLLVK